MNHPLSWLFVPGSRPDRFGKAFDSGADAVILDLEDAVAEPDKAMARDHVMNALTGPASGATARAVRINPLTRSTGLLDLAALAALDTPPDHVVVPKVEHPEQIRLAAEVLSGSGPALSLVALIESAKGLAHAAEIAQSHPALTALMFGAADYAADLGQSVGRFDDSHARALVVNAAATAGLAAIDSPHFVIDDDSLTEAACRDARARGFSAKAAIHPRHLPAIRTAFGWSQAERDRARAILDVAPDGVGVLDGRMVDRAMVRWARRVLG